MNDNETVSLKTQIELLKRVIELKDKQIENLQKLLKRVIELKDKQIENLQKLELLIYD